MKGEFDKLCKKIKIYYLINCFRGLEERQAIDEGPKLTKYEIEEITRKNEMEVDEDNPENALGLGFKLFY